MPLSDCLPDLLHSTETRGGRGAANSEVYVGLQTHRRASGDTHTQESLHSFVKMKGFSPSTLSLHSCSDAADYSVSQFVSGVLVIKRPKAFSTGRVWGRAVDDCRDFKDGIGAKGLAFL